MKTDSLLIQKLIDKSTQLQHQVDSMQIQQKLNELAYKFEHQNKIAAEANAFYEASWNKLLWLMITIGGILAFVIPYLMGVKERRDLKMLESNFKNKLDTFDLKLKKMNKNLKLSEEYSVIKSILFNSIFDKSLYGLIKLSSIIGTLPEVMEHEEVDKTSLINVLEIILENFNENSLSLKFSEILKSIKPTYQEYPIELKSSKADELILEIDKVILSIESEILKHVR